MIASPQSIFCRSLNRVVPTLYTQFHLPRPLQCLQAVFTTSTRHPGESAATWQRKEDAGGKEKTTARSDAEKGDYRSSNKFREAVRKGITPAHRERMSQMLVKRFSDPERRANHFNDDLKRAARQGFTPAVLERLSQSATARYADKEVAPRALRERERRRNLSPEQRDTERLEKRFANKRSRELIKLRASKEYQGLTSEGKALAEVETRRRADEVQREQEEWRRGLD